MIRTLGVIPAGVIIGALIACIIAGLLTVYGPRRLRDTYGAVTGLSAALAVAVLIVASVFPAS